MLHQIINFDNDPAFRTARRDALSGKRITCTTYKHERRKQPPRRENYIIDVYAVYALHIRARQLYIGAGHFPETFIMCKYGCRLHSPASSCALTHSSRCRRNNGVFLPHPGPPPSCLTSRLGPRSGTWILCPGSACFWPMATYEQFYRSRHALVTLE